MPFDRLSAVLESEIAVIDARGSNKRHEVVVAGVVPPTDGHGPRYLLEGQGDKPFLKMNSNNYLGMGLRPRPGLSWYAGTKGAAITLTKAMAIELAPDRIRVAAINPVMGETGLLADFLPGEDSTEVRNKIIATIPLGRLSQPIDIAKATAFLASDEADFITGVALEVDGGRCI